MRLEQHISKARGQWHCHLYMTKEEYKKQPITHITNYNNLNKLIGIPSEIKSSLFSLFHSGLVYVELKKEILK